MRTFKIIIPLIFLFIHGCTSDVEKINKEIDTRFDEELFTAFEPVVATIPFIYSANPENYWYPRGTTVKEVVNDEFKIGFKKLSELDNFVSQISTDDPELNDAIDALHFEIIEAQREIREAQKSLEQINSIFGFGLLGGMNTLYDFGSMFNSNNKAGVETTEMPKKVNMAFKNLQEAIFQSGLALFKKTYEFETDLIGTTKITDDQMLQVRSYLKQTITTKVKQYYTDTDTIVRNAAVKDLVEYYDELFPSEHIVISESDGIQMLIKNGDFILPTNTFVLSTKLKKAPSIDSDEYDDGTCKWEFSNGIVLSAYPSSNGEIHHVSINCDNNAEISGLPYDLTFNKTTLEESQSKFKAYTPQKLPTYENGRQDGYWLKFKKDKYWVYLSFSQSSILYSILLATFEIDKTS